MACARGKVSRATSSNLLTTYLTYDIDVLEVVGLEPHVDGLAREAAIGEGEPG